MLKKIKLNIKNKKGISEKTMNEKLSEATDNNKRSIIGIVTAKKCDCCGHHEMGFISPAGTYIAFKPGMTVKIIKQNDG